MSYKTVTRFAPSPTGFMHIGNLRTALYAYLLARSDKGTFILRIEDTDRERYVEGAVEVILQTLKDCKMDYDEGPIKGGEHGPYVQSERKEIYVEYAKRLVDEGKAYYCFCTKERLDALHEEEGVGGGYDRHCRDLPKEEIEKNLTAGVPYVIRQKMPLTGTTSYHDEVFGDISMENADMQDQILLKADGYPTYNFCHVIDDYLMGVTHVVRGSEYLTSTPKYALLYDAFGWERPTYVHLPMIMGKNEDGTVSKLSKRHGSVSFAALLEEGYLPEAIVNYISLLGWCPKDTNEEFFSLNELCEIFSAEGISKSPATFDYDKLMWFNGEYIKRLSEEEFFALTENQLAPFKEKGMDIAHLARLAHSRVSKLTETADILDFFLELPEFSEELYFNKKNKTSADTARAILPDAIGVIEKIDDWNNDSLFAVLSDFAAGKEMKTGAMMWIIRIAVAGKSVTPGGATEIMEILGKEESLKRLKESLSKL